MLLSMILRCFKLSVILAVFTAFIFRYYGFTYESFVEIWMPCKFIFRLLYIDRFASSAYRLYTADELALYDGVQRPNLYLSLMGNVYDVSKGRKHYEAGSNYNIFVGRDASKSFVTGEFDDPTKELDDVLSLSPKDLVGLETWMQMYEEQYEHKGKLIGRFYDYNGRETEYLKHVKAKLEEGKAELFKKKQTSKQYPSCNSEWSADVSRVWCTDKSGGIDRNWVGVPRLMHAPGVSEPRCVCVDPMNDELLNNPRLKVYEDCDQLSESCDLKK